MNAYLHATAASPEIDAINATLAELVARIEELQTKQAFLTHFVRDPCRCLGAWLESQSLDLRSMLDMPGATDDERRAAYYRTEPSVQEAVRRYISGVVQQQRLQRRRSAGGPYTARAR